MFFLVKIEKFISVPAESLGPSLYNYISTKLAKKT